VAEIAMRPDNIEKTVWWLHWGERGEVVGRIDQESDGRFTLTPLGLHWSPLKTFARSFESPSSALREVQLYFQRR
jgi:hypothetical protein